MNLKRFGLNWVLDPADTYSIIPDDYLFRMSTLVIDASKDQFNVTNPDGVSTEYTKGDYLGSGTFGDVYECVRNSAGVKTSCVVKSIKDAGAIRKAILETIIQICVSTETEKSSYPEYDLVGPFAPRVYDIAYDPATNKCYIFSERMRKTVRDVLQGWELEKDKGRPRLPYVLIRICLVLSELYKKLKFNHRDFKTDNCMYIRDAKGQLMPRIIDFGFSCIEYKGLKIQASTNFRHCSLEGRDMSQFIYETFHYNKWIHPDLRNVAEALLTQKRDGAVCKVLDKQCGVRSWSNTYNFYNTLTKANPNGHPLIVRKVFEAFVAGSDWKKELAFSVPEPCHSCGVKDKAKDCVCMESDEWVNPIGIPCPALKPHYNPATKRCVKICPDGKYRNKAFKCVTRKNSTAARPGAAVAAVAGPKPCRPAKPNYNPKTRRCVKKCPDGQRRNKDFKCEKNVGAIVPRPNAAAAVAAPVKAVKACPASKELNPLTGRCVNTCPPGKMRNTRFRCVKPTSMRKIAVNAAVADGKRCPVDKPDYNPATKRCVKPCPTGKKRDPATFKCVSNKP